jgi:hypothetical protein
MRVKEMVKTKLSNVREKRYVTPGQVHSLTSYFWVPKGDQDIRMVYDTTKSGLNTCIWSPSFSLPSADSFTDNLESGSWMMDMGLGEMFLNFPLDEQLRPYCGIDLRPFFPEEAGEQTLWEHWVRCMMGLRSSPYCTIKTLLLGYETVTGDRHRPDNAFRWTAAKLNLLGSATYNPSMPWVYRVRETGRIASTIKIYVDDLRPIAESEQDCWLLGHQAAAALQFLGIQVLARKTRPPSQHPGAWAGTVAVTGSEGVGMKVAQGKWDKAKRLVQELLDELDTKPTLDRKVLESIRGFFIHLQRTYPAITPFIKGLHLSIDGWRPG